MDINELIQEVAEMIGNHTKTGLNGLICDREAVESLCASADANCLIGDVSDDGASIFSSEDVAFCFIECVQYYGLEANTDVYNGCKEVINMYQATLKNNIGGYING
jgi:hypothetical protein